MGSCGTQCVDQQTRLPCFTRRGVDTSPEYLKSAIQHSLDRLQTRIDLYYLHRVEDDGARIDEGMSPARVALAWVLSRAPHVVPIPGTRKQQARGAQWRG